MPKIKYERQGIVSFLLNFRLLVLLSNFVFQGIRHMSRGEACYKVSLTVLFACLIDVYFSIGILPSLFLGHIINYLVNGQFYVLLRYLSNKEVLSKQSIASYISFIEKCEPIFSPLDVLYIGSFCRGVMSRHSDLDIRIYHSPKFFSSLKCYFMATVLRFWGMCVGFPVDVYCFSQMSFLNKVSPKEIPTHFSNHTDIIKKYPNSVHYAEQLKLLVIK